MDGNSSSFRAHSLRGKFLKKKLILWRLKFVSTIRVFARRENEKKNNSGEIFAIFREVEKRNKIPHFLQDFVNSHSNSQLRKVTLKRKSKNIEIWVIFFWAILSFNYFLFILNFFNYEEPCSFDESLGEKKKTSWESFLENQYFSYFWKKALKFFSPLERQEEKLWNWTQEKENPLLAQFELEENQWTLKPFKKKENGRIIFLWQKILFCQFLQVRQKRKQSSWVFAKEFFNLRSEWFHPENTIISRESEWLSGTEWIFVH